MHNPFKSKNDSQPADGPPSYDAAVANDRPSSGMASRNPFVNVTDPVGHSSVADSNDHGLHRTESNESGRSHIDTYKADRLMDDDKLRELDDEMRELPDGWVRCFDPKSQHHFYVEEATRRSIWVHPYDDHEFLSKLPDTHPANPNSKEAQLARQQAEDEALAWKLHQEELQASGQGGGGNGPSAGPGPGNQGSEGGAGGKGGYRSEQDYINDKKTPGGYRTEDDYINDKKGKSAGGYRSEQDYIAGRSGGGGSGGGAGSQQDHSSGNGYHNEKDTRNAPAHPQYSDNPQGRGANSSGVSAGFHNSRSNPYESEPTPQEGRPWQSYKDSPEGDSHSHKHRNWFQREKDKAIGTKEERAQHKEERRQQKEAEKERLRKQQEDYIRRRQELVDKQINDGTIGGGMYNSDPYAYAPPSTPFNRSYYDSPIGYGYGGGYGRRYGYGPYGGGFGGYGGYGYGGYGGLGYGGLGYGGLGYGGLGLGLGGGLLGGALLGDALFF